MMGAGLGGWGKYTVRMMLTLTWLPGTIPESQVDPEGMEHICVSWLMGLCFGRVAVEVVTTMTSADVMWQDGSVECNIRSNDLFPVHHLDNNEFCPGDFVVDKRGSVGLRVASGTLDKALGQW